MCAESVGPGGLLLLSGLLFAGGTANALANRVRGRGAAGGPDGLPGNHMPGGALDRAAHKDLKQWLAEHHCDEYEYEEFCEGQEDSAECIKECGQ